MLKQLGCFTLLCAAATAAGLAFYWNQSTHLPNWYRSHQTTETDGSVLTQDQIDEPAELKRLKTQLNERVEGALSREDVAERFPQGVATTALDPAQPEPTDVSETVDSTSAQVKTVWLDASEFNAFLATNLAERQAQQPLLSAVNAIHTEIESGTVTSGIVIDFSKVPLEQLAPQQQAMVQKMQQFLPIWGNQTVYLGMEGQPTLEAGHLSWNKRMRMIVGGLTFQVSEVAEHLDISLAEIERPMALQLGRLQVQSLEFQDQYAVFKGTVP